MEDDKLIKRALDFKKKAKRLFNSPDGLKVLAYMKDSYVDNTALGQDTNETMYKLGRKEFIQGLVRLINEPDRIDDIIIKDTISEE